MIVRKKMARGVSFPCPDCGRTIREIKTDNGIMFVDLRAYEGALLKKLIGSGALYEEPGEERLLFLNHKPICGVTIETAKRGYSEEEMDIMSSKLDEKQRSDLDTNVKCLIEELKKKGESYSDGTLASILSRRGVLSFKINSKMVYWAQVRSGLIQHKKRGKSRNAQEVGKDIVSALKPSEKRPASARYELEKLNEAVTMYDELSEEGKEYFKKIINT